jgi:hypothetical protein
VLACIRESDPALSSSRFFLRRVLVVVIPDMSSSDALLTQILERLDALQISQQALQAKVCLKFDQKSRNTCWIDAHDSDND